MSENKEHKHHFQNIEIKKLPKSEVEITGEIAAELLEEMRKEAIKGFAADAELPGFRKGKAPEEMIVEKIGEMAILQAAAEKALQQEYPHILYDNKIEAVGQPQVAITKLAPGNPIGFKISTITMPTLNMADYKKLAEKHDSTVQDVIATDEDVDQSIEQVRQNFAFMSAQQGATEKAETGLVDKEGNPLTSLKPKEPELPEINDEFVKKLGDFKDVDDFKLKLKEGITKEKEAKEKDKNRTALLDKIIADTKVDLPDLLVEGELDRILMQFKDDVMRAAATGGQKDLTFEKYLEDLNKTEQDLRAEWREGAEKRAKMQLILNQIAIDEKIVPDEDKVKQNTDHILEHHKDADRGQVTIYVTTLLTNEKTIDYLEGMGSK